MAVDKSQLLCLSLPLSTNTSLNAAVETSWLMSIKCIENEHICTCANSYIANVIILIWAMALGEEIETQYWHILAVKEIVSIIKIIYTNYDTRLRHNE